MAGIMVFVGSLYVAGPSLLAGFGMGGLHIFLKNKGFAQWKIAATSLTVASCLTIGAAEVLTRLGENNPRERNKIRYLFLLPALAGLSLFSVGYGGILGSRVLLGYGKKRFDNYIIETSKKS